MRNQHRIFGTRGKVGGHRADLKATSQLRADFTEGAGPAEALLRRKAETDRIREGISKGCLSADPEGVAPGGVEAVEPQYPICLNKSFQTRSVSSSKSLERIVTADDRMNRDTTCRSVRPLLYSRNGEACTV
jgi:hypothetical protein